MTVTGKIYLIEDEKVISDKFKKRGFVVETQDQYPQFIPMQFTQDKCNVLNEYSVGQLVEVSVNLRGNKTEYDGEQRFFLSLDAWKIEKTGEADLPY